MVELTPSKFIGGMAGIALLAFAPALLLPAGIVLLVILGARAAAARDRERQMISPDRVRPVELDWKMLEIPIEQRDWARRNNGI